MEFYATIQNEGAVKFPFMHTGVDESSLGAFLTAVFEEQAPMVQSDDSADVNRARDARTAARHANRFLKICNIANFEVGTERSAAPPPNFIWCEQ